MRRRLLFHVVEVTRSLSNLYKQYFVANQSEKTRVINSNEIVEKRLAELKKQEAALAAGAGEGGFVAGLGAPVVEVEPEEPQIDYEEEARAKAEAILTDAKSQADGMIEDAKGQAQEIHDKAREEGYRSGYDEGRQQALKELEEKKAELEQERLRQQRQYDEQLEDMEEIFIP